MAFESSVLQNGQWTTQTLDVNTVLRHYDQQDQAATANTVEIEEAPDLGLLTQTVIRSPAVHWILPVKLRHPDKNDVAFIGVRDDLLLESMSGKTRLATHSISVSRILSSASSNF